MDVPIWKDGEYLSLRFRSDTQKFLEDITEDALENFRKEAKDDKRAVVLFSKQAVYVRRNSSGKIIEARIP